MFGFPLNNEQKNTWFYKNNGTSYFTTGEYFTWVKPADISFINLIAVGAGGGGGNGYGAASGNPRGGGGGGAAGGITIATFATSDIPDVLYIGPGVGGASANAGGDTYVAAGRPYVSSSSTVYMIAPGGYGGATATSGIGGGGATTITASTRDSCPHILYSLYYRFMGSGGSGTAGGSTTPTAPINVVPFSATGFFITGGAGGGYVTNLDVGVSGASISATAMLNPEITGGSSGGAGGSGIINQKPFYALGGAGGAGNGSGTGGAGGIGGPGCGGGGGGGGTTGGAGGKGGSGFVIITAW